MDHLEFFKKIPAGLSGAYLFQGVEEYVKESALRALCDSLDEATRALNLQYLDTAEADPLITACETLPFFASRRLVVCRALPKEHDGKAILAYLPRMPETTLLVFFLRGEAETRSALYKRFKEQDRTVDFGALSESAAAKWVLQQAAKTGALITPAAAKLLVELVGCDLTCLNNEFQKAAGYAGSGREITREIISLCVTRNIEYRVFDMMDYFLAAKAPDGLRALAGLIKDNEDPMGVASLLLWQFKLLLLARRCVDKGMNREAALKAMGGATYPNRKAFDACRRYTEAELARCVGAFADVGYLQISGQAKAMEALEAALIRCMPQRG